jgi:tetratricopeptide (TPR) repeat protein
MESNMICQPGQGKENGRKRSVTTWLSVGWMVCFTAMTAHAGPHMPQLVNEADRVPLFANLGTLHHPMTTSSSLAQQYFDQGLRLVFAFNHEEAINSFREAARLDPKAAMPHWGIALALGPNINLPMDQTQEKQAIEAIQAALKLVKQVSPKERSYIETLAIRYSTTSAGSRARLDAAYTEAMKTLWQRYPDDATAGALYAGALMNLQPWDYWTPEGRPKGRTEDIVAVLERVLATNPDHPGACHYYIHAVEASSRPERALPCAERLARLAPGAGHLVHMPAHIYLRLGLYDKAAEHNVHAVSVDDEYLAHRNLSGIYPVGYAPHNVHFLWAALTMEGRSREALQVARGLHQKVSWEQARKEPALEEFTPTLPFALVRFGQWNEMLALPKPPEELLYTTVIWHYARGVALAATKRFGEAQRERETLVGAARRLPEDRTVGVVPVVQLARIAELVLAGEIAARQGRLEVAIKTLKEATALEDAVRYYEPPLWHIPVRHSLGEVLLQAGRAADAEQTYRQDLRQHPRNGWALFGLEQSLKAQKQEAEAADVHNQFEQAWARADITLTASRF